VGIKRSIAYTVDVLSTTHTEVTCVDYFYDGWTSKQKQPFTVIIKLGRAKTFFNITLIVSV